MAFIAKSTIQEVKDRLDAIAVVGEYVRLEKKGGRWWGRCPFHAGGQEKTPSFKVDPDLKMYHCFGCGKGDSVISFIMEMDKITFPEVIRNLARKMGIEIVYEDGHQGENEFDYTRKDELYELYRRTTTTFQHFLLEKPEGKNALQYITDRGISREMVEKFLLGFAPEKRDFLHDFLGKKGYSDDFLEKSGLFSSRYKKLPLFNGRLMFPIMDRQGRVVAFSGRSMSNHPDSPKYINSPETEIYKKGQTLYALNLAMDEMRRSKTVYLAEGNLDVIAMFQAGITNTVAPLGTAFTEEQAALLRRWAEKIILIFDNDEAGHKAAYKAIISCRKNGFTCKLVQPNEEFKDPADILQKFGPEILKKNVENTIFDIEYLLMRCRSQFLAAGSSKNRAAEFIFPFIQSLDSEIERTNSIEIVADVIGVNRAAVQDDYLKWITGGQSRQEVLSKKPFLTNKIRMNAELFLLTVVAVNMKLYPEFRGALEIKEIDDPCAKELFIAMEECYIHEENDIDSLLARIKDDELKNFITCRGTSPEFNVNFIGEECTSKARRLMEDGINEIKKKRIRLRLEQISAEMRNNERDIQRGVSDSEEIFHLKNLYLNLWQ